MFKKMEAPQYPPRQWAIYGAAGSGKSHFASQMKAPALVIDSDARFTEQIQNATGPIYQLSDEHQHNTDPDKIASLIKDNLPGSGVRTIVVDSLTAILRPVINQALGDIEAGRVKNGVTAFRGKALAMNRLQDAIAGSGVDCLWIWHTHESRNAKAELVKRASIPETELVRLRRSLNVILKLEVSDDGKRTVLVEWARNGRSGIRLEDKAGGWRGMPELIEAAIYAEGVKDSNEKPTTFASVQDAIAWGFEQGCFRAVQHAEHAYEKCKRLEAPKTSAEMWKAWIADVERRVAEAEAQDLHDETLPEFEPVDEDQPIPVESDGDRIYA